MTDITDVKGIGPAKAETLAEEGYETIDDLANAEQDELADVNGVGGDRALEYMVSAADLAEDDESDSGEEEFDLTPAEIADEVDEEEEEEEEEEEPEPEPETDPEYEITVTFDSMLEYDVFHAALMRYHENIYTSHQPTADIVQEFLNELNDFESVEYSLSENELNTLHTAVKQTRSNYQGSNLIDHMDALVSIENQIDDARSEHLF